jgi:sugar phosphate isomerase/epimerase
VPTYVSTTVFDDGTPVCEAARRLVDAGRPNIELGSTHNYEPGILDGLKKIPGRYITHNFFPPTADRLVLNIASEDADIRRESIAFIKAGVDFASELGAEIYTIHPGFLTDPKGEAKTAGSYDFNFDTTRPPDRAQYRRGTDLFFDALDDIARYVEGRGVKIAIETQGSATKKEFILFSEPVDFQRFLDQGYGPEIGINLNLAHTYLASLVTPFDVKQAIHMLTPRVFAIEVSHNNGKADEHKSLVDGAWYFPLLKDRRFKDVAVIFEARNVSMGDVERSCVLLDRLYS